jgi:hypothetical protein
MAENSALDSEMEVREILGLPQQRRKLHASQHKRFVALSFKRLHIDFVVQHMLSRNTAVS